MLPLELNNYTKVTDELSNERPYEENIGREWIGCGVGIEALGSPI